MVVPRVEVRAFPLEVRLLASVDHWLVLPFGKPGFPIGTEVIVGQICDYESRGRDADYNSIINQPGRRRIMSIIIGARMRELRSADRAAHSACHSWQSSSPKSPRVTSLGR